MSRPRNVNYTSKFVVTGMSCDGCRQHAKKALAALQGIQEVQLDSWQNGITRITSSREISSKQVSEALATTGYGVKYFQHEDIPSRRQSPKTNDAGFDLIVIGSGSAGMASAIRAAEAGASVAIIEGGTLGGTCVNVGCVPSKLLIRAADARWRAVKHPFHGIHTEAGPVAWRALREQKDALVDSLRSAKYADVLAGYSNKIKMLQGWASLNKDTNVVVNQEIIRGSKIIIATGARPRRLELSGADLPGVLDSTSLLATEKLPDSLIVIGGRAVALELGQAFSRLGTKVTILQRSERILPDHDPAISMALSRALRAEDIDIITGVTPDSIQESRNGLTVAVLQNNKVIEAENVLMAVGRNPNTQNMGLEKAGIELDHRGFIKVDERLQTSNPKVYAAGDVTTLPEFVYVAAAAGGVAGSNALGQNQQVLDLEILPAVVFTEPQVAMVGLTQAMAQAIGIEATSSTLPIEHVPFARAGFQSEGLIKLIADPATDRLLGAHILADGAGDMIQTAALAIRFGKDAGFTVSEMGNMLFPYLTRNEGVKLAAQAFRKDVASLSCCAA